MKKLLWSSLALLVLLSTLVSGACSKSSTKYIIATDATWAPFESVNEQTKQVEGFDIDLMNAIAAKEGLEIEFKNVAFDPLLAGMAQGTYDAAISSITITADRAAQMSFSDPYFNAGQVVVVKKDNTTITSKDNLGGKKVGAQLGTTGAIEVGKISGADLKTYDDIGLAYQDLMNGQIDAVVADNPVALLYVSQNSAKLKTVGTTFTSEFYGIAVNKNKPELLTKINAGLAAVKAEGLIDQLTTKWWPK